VIATRVLPDRCGGHSQRSCAHDYYYKFFPHFVLVVGQAPRLPGHNGNRSGCPTNRTRLRSLRREKAERERRDSAARLIQRMKARRAALYPGTMLSACCVEV